MLDMGFVPGESMQVGDWSFEGMINNQIEVYSSSHAPEGAISIMLVSGRDAPAHLIYVNGVPYVTPLAALPATLSVASDYIERIEII